MADDNFDAHVAITRDLWSQLKSSWTTLDDEILVRCFNEYRSIRNKFPLICQALKANADITFQYIVDSIYSYINDM